MFKYTLDEILELIPILYIANMLEFYPELLKIINELKNFLSEYNCIQDLEKAR